MCQNFYWDLYWNGNTHFYAHLHYWEVTERVPLRTNYYSTVQRAADLWSSVGIMHFHIAISAILNEDIWCCLSGQSLVHCGVTALHVSKSLMANKLRQD